MKVPASISALTLQYTCVYVYLAAPRAILTAVAPRSELALTAGFLDRRLAYTGVALALYHLIRFAYPRAASLLLRGWLHAEFLAGSLEVAVMYSLGFGFSPLFFHHWGLAADRVAITGYWPLLLGALILAMLADWLLRRVLRTPSPSSPALPALALALVALFGVRSVDILHRHGVMSEFAPLALVANWHASVKTENVWAQLKVTPAERAFLATLDVGREPEPPLPNVPRAPRNLITIYLEGFQANFEGLTPNLDRFAARHVRFDRFFNAVTPTINALVSSQCGILAEVEHNELDEGFTRNLECLPDLLHKEGYYQVFLGGADAGFSGKAAFLRAHGFDEVWGREEWAAQHADQKRENVWGLYDADLVDQAITRLPQLVQHGPFHLSILTLDSHPPGFPEPDCPGVDPQHPLRSAISCTDRAIGRLLDQLESGGYLKNTAVVVMGDHMIFPSTENVADLGPSVDGWFGRVFMAVAAPGDSARLVHSASYTPDFAPIALDALGFHPVPAFPFGRSALSLPDHRRLLVAPHFELVDGDMRPSHPNPIDHCGEEEEERTTIDPSDGLSPCEREKLIDITDRLLNRFDQ